MNKIVFIASKGKKNYFSSLCKGFCESQLLNKKELPLPSIRQFVNSSKDLRKPELNYIAEYFLKLKERKYKTSRPLLWSIYQRVIYIRSLIYYARYKKYLKTCDCEWIGLWGGHYLDDRAAEIAALKLGIRTVFFENGLLPNTTTVDVKGVNYKNSVPRDKSFYDHYVNKGDSNIAQNLVARKPVKNTTSESITLPANYIFVPFQVDTDTQIILYGDWIGSMRKLFSVIQSASNDISNDIAFVFKEHPSSPVNYDDLLPSSSDSIIFANGNSTEELIKHAAAVITVNSTVGIESLMLGKRVITLGKAFYSIPGLVKQASSLNELISALNSLDAWSANPMLVEKFVAYLRDDYLVDGSWRTPDKEHQLNMSRKLTNLMES